MVFCVHLAKPVEPTRGWSSGISGMRNLYFTFKDDRFLWFQHRMHIVGQIAGSGGVEPMGSIPVRHRVLGYGWAVPVKDR